MLAPETVEEMHAFQAMTDLEHWTQGHGLALMLMRRGERIFSGHSGAHLGFLSNVAVDRKRRTVFRFLGGRLEALARDGSPGTDLTRFDREGEDRYRAVSGSERGELLRLVRDQDGRVVRMYLASYPFTRTPEPMARVD